MISIKNTKSKYFLLLGLSWKRMGLLKTIYKKRKLLFLNQNSKPKYLLKSKWKINNP